MTTSVCGSAYPTVHPGTPPAKSNTTLVNPSRCANRTSETVSASGPEAVHPFQSVSPLKGTVVVVVVVVEVVVVEVVVVGAAVVVVAAVVGATVVAAVVGAAVVGAVAVVAEAAAVVAASPSPPPLASSTTTSRITNAANTPIRIARKMASRSRRASSLIPTPLVLLSQR